MEKKEIRIRCEGECGKEIAIVEQDSKGRASGYYLFSGTKIMIDKHWGLPGLVCSLCGHFTINQAFTEAFKTHRLAKS